MTLIRHCIVDTTTNKVVNIIDYENVQTGVPAGLESNLLCVASNTGEINDTYENGVFTSPQPFPSWSLINNIWTPPEPMPIDNNFYVWNESTKSWAKI